MACLLITLKAHNSKRILCIYASIQERRTGPYGPFPCLWLPPSGGVSPGGIPGEVFQHVEPAGLEFFPDKPQPEHPAPEGVFLVVRLRLSGGGFLLGQCLMGHRQTELDVCLDFPGVEGAVEKPEFHRPFGEGGVEVEPVVPAVVVMFIPTKGCLDVPDVGKFCHGSGLLLVQFPEEGFICLLAVSGFPEGVDLEGMVDHIFLAGHQVYQVPQGFRGELLGSHMDVNPAGGVHQGPGFSQGPYQFLQLRDVVVGKDGAYHFRPVVPGGALDLAAHLSLRSDAGVAHGFPCPSLVIQGGVGIVGSAFIGAPSCSEETGHQVGSLFSRNPRHFHFNPEVQCFHPSRHPFARFVCSLACVYITLNAQNSKGF